MKLEWHKDTKEDVNWQEAVDYCESLGDGWRLPTIEELTSATDDWNLKDKDTWFSVKGFLESSYYWSSTTYARNNDYAWLVYVHSGYVNYCLKSSTSYARAVREVKI